MTKQLNKLVNVIKVRDMDLELAVSRELALFKIACADGLQRGALMQIADVFRGKVVDVASHSVIIEVTGTTAKIEAFHEMVCSFGLVEMMRTGQIAIARGCGET
ncbi:MAG: acetolactate synthase small subunit [Solirubrobacteraceae bacterium]